MPEYVFEREDEKKYEIKPALLKRVASHDSKLYYLDTLNYTQLLQESKRADIATDLNYTFDPDTADEVPVESKDAEVVEANDQLMAEAVAAAQQDAVEELNESLDAIATNKFNAIVANDRKESETFLASVKKAHQNDYDAYITSLRQTAYYQKCLEKWKKHYSEIKEQCVNTTKAEIDAHAQSEAIAEAENEKVVVPVTAPVQKNAPIVVEPEEVKVYKYVPKHISTNMVIDQGLKDKIVDILTTESYKSIQKSYMMYYLDNNKQAAERNEELKVIEEEKKQLDNEFVAKVQTITDEKEKKKAEREYNIKTAKLEERKFEAEKSVEIFNYRKELLDRLQSAHNMLAPQRSFDEDRFEIMKENVDNNRGNVTNEVLADILLLEMGDKIIPEIADNLTLRVQEMLLMNDKPNFNIEKESLEKLLDKITEKSQLADNVKAANLAVNGKLAISRLLLSEASRAMAANRKKDEEYAYDAEKFVAIKQKIEENKQSNVGKMNQTDYTRIEMALNTIEEFAKKTAAKEEVTTQDRTNLRNAQRSLRDIKKLATVEEDLNKKTSKLFKSTNGIRLITDYLIADFVESASNAYARGSLSAFEYTQEDVKTDIERMKKFVQNNYESHVITAELLDGYSIDLQAKREKMTNQNEIDSLNKVLDEVVTCSMIAEDDEIKQESHNVNKEDEKAFDEHQNRFIKALQISEEVLRTNKAEKLSKATVENMRL